jgi:hypothetical protein
MNSLVKTVTWVMGIALVATGVLGFINDPVLGLFEVDTIHNLVHLLSGIVAIIAVVSGESYARLFLIVFGLVYAAVAVVGFVQVPTGTGTLLGLMEINGNDNYLHTGIALVCLAAGFAGGKKRLA